MENEKNGLYEILELLQDADSRSFYAFVDETNKFRKGRRKVVNFKIRDALEELARVIEKENEERERRKRIKPKGKDNQNGNSC